MKDDQIQPSHQHRVMAISTAAILERLLVHPLENIISHKQLNSGMSFYSIVDDLYKRQGFKSFYSGISWPLASCVPGRLLMFGTYLYSKDIFYGSSDNKLYISVVSGVLSGVTETLVNCPADAYRVRKTFNVSVANQYSPNILYKGGGVFVLKCSIANTIIMGGSDWMIDHAPASLQSPYLPFLTGTISGGVAQLFSTPLDVVKTKVMEDYSDKNYKVHLREIFEEGSFFSSLSLRIIRQSIGFGLMTGLIGLFQEYQRRCDQKHVFCVDSQAELQAEPQAEPQVEPLANDSSLEPFMRFSP